MNMDTRNGRFRAAQPSDQSRVTERVTQSRRYVSNVPGSLISGSGGSLTSSSRNTGGSLISNMSKSEEDKILTTMSFPIKQSYQQYFKVQSRPLEFFVPGRVFDFLWHETTSSLAERRASEPRDYLGTTGPQNFHTRWVQDQDSPYSCQFVVILAQPDFCICCPINSWRLRNSAARNGNYSIIYSKGRTPWVMNGEPDAMLTKSIPVNMEGQNIFPPDQRIFFDQFCRVEYHHQVQDVGIVCPTDTYLLKRGIQLFLQTKEHLTPRLRSLQNLLDEEDRSTPSSQPLLDRESLYRDDLDSSSQGRMSRSSNYSTRRSFSSRNISVEGLPGVQRNGSDPDFSPMSTSNNRDRTYITRQTRLAPPELLRSSSTSNVNSDLLYAPRDPHERRGSSYSSPPSSFERGKTSSRRGSFNSGSDRLSVRGLNDNSRTGSVQLGSDVVSSYDGSGDGRRSNRYSSPSIERWMDEDDGQDKFSASDGRRSRMKDSGYSSGSAEARNKDADMWDRGADYEYDPGGTDSRNRRKG